MGDYSKFWYIYYPQTIRHWTLVSLPTWPIECDCATLGKCQTPKITNCKPAIVETL